MNSLKSPKFFNLIILIASLCSFNALIASDTSNEQLYGFISTNSGMVPTQKIKGVLLWEDIPYALPPVDDLRWKAPRSFIDRESKILPKDYNFCHQEIGGEIQEIYEMGSEDCLYLDIRAPNNKNKNLPVMFWIHGGGNTSGHKDFYDFSKFVKEKNLIVVSPNYRLGPLGFFTHPSIQELNADQDRTSNFGILDIIHALNWVKENIKKFGGDPNNITIFGESAGGHNVFSLLVAPQAKGLFHKAISQSGYTKSSSLEDAYKSKDFNKESTSDSWTVFNKIAKSKGLASDMNEADAFQSSISKQKQRDILYSTNAQELVNLYGDTFEIPLLTNDDVVIPIIGLKNALGSEEFLHKVPTIAGSNKDEIKLWIGFSKYFIETEDAFLSKTFGIPKIMIRDVEKYELYSSIRAKGWQLRGVQEPLDNIFNTGNSDVYAYRFDWDNLRDFFVGDFSEIIGSAHAIEIPMVSGDFTLAEEFRWIVYPRSISRRFMQKNMMSFWANFARNGEPGVSSNGLVWEKYNPNTSQSIILLDEKKNLKNSILNLDMRDLVNEIKLSNILDHDEKCILLYETTNYIGDNTFDLFVNELTNECSREDALRISKRNSGSINL